jgi:hypothetical protein
MERGAANSKNNFSENMKSILSSIAIKIELCCNDLNIYTKKT